MYLHRIGDLTLAASARVAGLPETRQASSLWTFVLSRRSAPRAREWYHQSVWHGLEQPWRSLGRLGGAHIVRFHRTATFVLDEASRRITGHACAATSREVMHQVLLSQVMPLVLGLSGRLVLHASAVRTPHGAVGFVGPPRRGKSTLAVALAARGCPLLSDDCLVIETAGNDCQVLPVDIGVRLRPDAARLVRATSAGRAKYRVQEIGKRRFSVRDLGVSGRARRTPLRMLYLLDPQPEGTRLRSTGVSPREALVALLEANFQVEHDDPARLRNVFARLAHLVARVEVRRLAYPRVLAALPDLVDTVLADVSAP